MAGVEDWQAGGFALYVHWPYCTSKCPYCDFNSHVSALVDHRAWLEAYRSAVTLAAEETPGRSLRSIFFGGGTPSLMEPAVVAGVIEAARACWVPANDIEITLEANPGSVERGRLRGYAEAGVNRLSMGVQALNDADLRRLGRLHSVGEAKAAFDVARACFDRVSFDLIYARQDQTREAWQAELREALAMAVDHLALYQLTIEDGTAFGARAAAGTLRGLPDDDLSADMYLDTQDICTSAGMAAYEVSNHARPDAQSRHNLVYWRQGDWVGIGPGAHGRVTVDGRRYATEAPRAPLAWLAAARDGSPGSVRTEIPRTEQATEYLLMSLRLVEGMDIPRYQTLAGRTLDARVIEDLCAMGLVRLGEDRLSVTDQGRPVLNAILRALA